MPLILFVYWCDPTLFRHEVFVWEHDMEIDVDEKWIRMMIENNPLFATEVEKHNSKHEGLRKKKQVYVAKAGFPELIGKLYQLQF